MKRLLLLASVLLLAVTAVRAAPPKRGAAHGRPAVPSAPAPDFWYVVPDDTPASDANRLVEGIVVPSSVGPTVQTTPAGSVISWSRPDGTRQSFAIQGVSSFTFEPGPLEGTTYVPFGRRSRSIYTTGDCCACASWNNSEESTTALACVGGCSGCGCEGCICSPTYPCPVAAPGDGMILSAHNGAGPTLKFGKSSANKEMAFVGHGATPVSFRGTRLAAHVNSNGETVIKDPDTIALPGAVATSSSIRGEKAFYTWSSPGASVILEQPRTTPPPSLHDGMIDFNPQQADAPTTAARHLQVNPDMDRCRVCGTHPNSQGDSDKCECVPGVGTCTRCIDFACIAAGSQD